MKFLILIFLLTPFSALAVKAPSYLKNGKIRLVRPGGVDNVTSDEFALVKRANLTKYKNKKPRDYGKQIITKTITKTIIRRNMLLLHAGTGKNGIFINREEPGFLLVQEKQVPVIGATYTRYIANGFSIGASAFSTNTFTATGGYSW